MFGFALPSAWRWLLCKRFGLILRWHPRYGSALASANC
ncbi:hypothetical protein K788_0004808 [Paraburkholderia caribensis MBA4]|uniref:Uncharacterized protein n=1 Tax=Paraburkholderia caribensis MBA4 TaxID=1323664 RepID=A0A0P0R7Q3_9BURK|nr:hypothetical protein K788_0004808 [Paraburkholderia caribensis MBA4]